MFCPMKTLHSFVSALFWSQSSENGQSPKTNKYSDDTVFLTNGRASWNSIGCFPLLPEKGDSQSTVSAPEFVTMTQTLGLWRTCDGCNT